MVSVCPPLLFRGPCFVSNKRGGGAQLFRDRSLAVLDFIVNIIVEGGRLFELSANFFYGNSCNSGTESRKMVSKVGN